MQNQMPKFLSAYNGRKEKYTPAGDKIEITFGYEINKRGQKVLMPNGETDVYAKVQEELEDSKIENILARVAAGDNTVFRPEGIYADISEAPKNLIEARRMILNLENTWNQIPKDIREKYNNDVELFIGQSGSETWLKDMGLIPDEKIQPITKTETASEPDGGNKE